MNSRQREAIKKRQGLNKQIHYLDGKTPPVHLTAGYNLKWEIVSDDAVFSARLAAKWMFCLNQKEVALHWEGDWEESTDGVKSSVIKDGSK